MKLRFQLSPFGQARLGTTLAVGLPVAVIAGGVTGWLFQSALLAAPFLLVLIGVCPALPGVALAVTGFRLRCRSRVVMATLGAVAGVAAVLSSWAVALHHARNHDLVWVESEIDAIQRGQRERQSGWEAGRRLGRSDLPPEERDEAFRDVMEMVESPFVPERLTETVRARTLGEYVDFRRQRGWPERGHEPPGLLVFAAWGAEILWLVAATAIVATKLVDLRLRCATHMQPLSPVVENSVPGVDHAALSAAAAREDLDAILAIPRWPESEREARYVVHRCPSCDFALVSVGVHWRSAGLRRTEAIVSNATLDPARLENLRTHLSP